MGFAVRLQVVNHHGEIRLIAYIPYNKKMYSHCLARVLFFFNYYCGVFADGQIDTRDPGLAKFRQMPEIDFCQPWQQKNPQYNLASFSRKIYLAFVLRCRCKKPTNRNEILNPEILNFANSEKLFNKQIFSAIYILKY